LPDILVAAALLLLPSAAFATCGTRGGPGYRGPDGHCVSWANIDKVCGVDRSRCQAENTIATPSTTTKPLPLISTVQAQAQYVDWGEKSARLDLGMSEQQVMNAVGYRPTKVEMDTCGQNTGKPWQCKIHTYGSWQYSLTVYFSQSSYDGTWHTNSWNVL
jgi:hypothetical protein